ncbi:hypothetical protein C8R43DRAFT_946110 [Mycena crocata]|nr:hypothetical protein C8R43DRAFT_946110 [Mycena crocata]
MSTSPPQVPPHLPPTAATFTAAAANFAAAAARKIAANGMYLKPLAGLIRFIFGRQKVPPNYCRQHCRQLPPMAAVAAGGGTFTLPPRREVHRIYSNVRSVKLKAEIVSSAPFSHDGGKQYLTEISRFLAFHSFGSLYLDSGFIAFSHIGLQVVTPDRNERSAESKAEPL